MFRIIQNDFSLKTINRTDRIGCAENKFGRSIQCSNFIRWIESHNQHWMSSASLSGASFPVSDDLRCQNVKDKHKTNEK